MIARFMLRKVLVLLVEKSDIFGNTWHANSCFRRIVDLKIVVPLM
jgi:hypothetical protein